jgi:hypothetical protein
MNFKNNIYLQLIPVVLFPFIFLFTTNEFIVTFWVLLLIASLLLIQYERGEWKVLGLGILAGLISEIGGDMIAKLQYWESGVLLGVPLWLPLLWGFGFVFIRRIGNKVLKKK